MHIVCQIIAAVLSSVDVYLSLCGCRRSWHRLVAAVAAADR